MLTTDLDELWDRLARTSATTPPRMASRVAAVPATTWLDEHTADPHTPPALDLEARSKSGPDHAEPSASDLDIGKLTLHAPNVDLNARAPAPRWRDRLHRVASTFDTTAAVWLSLGFICGMIVWHSIGFWGFVTEAVLPREQRGSHIAATASPAMPEQSSDMKTAPPLTTGSLPDAPRAVDASCVAVMLERTSSQTLLRPCSARDAHLGDAGRGQRADKLAGARERLEAPHAWTAEAQPAPAASAPATGATAFQDFDLSLTIE